MKALLMAALLFPGMVSAAELKVRVEYDNSVSVRTSRDDANLIKELKATCLGTLIREVEFNNQNYNGYDGLISNLKKIDPRIKTVRYVLQVKASAEALGYCRSEVTGTILAMNGEHIIQRISKSGVTEKSSFLVRRRMEIIVSGKVQQVTPSNLLNELQDTLVRDRQIWD